MTDQHPQNTEAEVLDSVIPEAESPEVLSADTFPNDLGASGVEQVESDSEFNQANLADLDKETSADLKIRNKMYTNVLASYYTYTDHVLSANVFRQESFYKISIAILIISPIQFSIVLFLSFWFENIAIVLTSAAEVIVAMFVFPKIIAEYLFNTNETTSINSIVSAIQNYDVSVLKGIRHTVEQSQEKKFRKK